MSTAHRLAPVVVLATVLAGCTGDPEDRSRLVQLGAPGESNRELTQAELDDLSAPEHTDADVAFVQGMIPHHRQALQMTAMVPERSTREDMRALTRRMEVAQADEIAQLERWLTERGEDVPGPHAQHGNGHRLMPGMLTADELDHLRAARGPAFETLFLQYMIRHHEGAVIMVEQLLTGGFGGQEPQVFQLAQHIDSDQRVEISRMKSLLAQGTEGAAGTGDEPADVVETFPGPRARTVGGAVTAMFTAYDRNDLPRWLGAWTDAGFRQAFGTSKAMAAGAAPGWSSGRSFSEGPVELLGIVEHGNHAGSSGHGAGTSEHGIGEHAVIETREAGLVARYRLDFERERNRWRVSGRTLLSTS